MLLNIVIVFCKTGTLALIEISKLFGPTSELYLYTQREKNFLWSVCNPMNKHIKITNKSI